MSTVKSALRITTLDNMPRDISNGCARHFLVSGSCTALLTVRYFDALVPFGPFMLQASHHCPLLEHARDNTACAQQTYPFESGLCDTPQLVFHIQILYRTGCETFLRTWHSAKQVDSTWAFAEVVGRRS